MTADSGRLQSAEYPVHNDSPHNGNRQAGDNKQHLFYEWGHASRDWPELNGFGKPEIATLGAALQQRQRDSPARHATGRALKAA